MQNDKQVKKYEPMMQVTCKDGRVLLFPKSKYEAFKTAVSELLLIPIEGVDVNKYEIKYVEDMPQDYDVLIGLKEDHRNKALAEFKKYKEALGYEPPRDVKMKKILRIIKKEN